MMRKAILFAVFLTLICFSRTEPARGQVLDNIGQTEITTAYSQLKDSRVSERSDITIATAIESENVGVNQGSEIIELAQNLVEDRTRAGTKDDDRSDETDGEWDPWESFNEKTFWFNRQVDRFLLKPVATAYNAVLPSPVRTGIANMFDNLDVTRRLVNSILQLKFDGVAREVARFTINSTVGVAGLFDVAGAALGITESNRDSGQTLGVYGVGHGPYLVLPLLPPLSVRDFFGFVADEAMYPLSYFIPTGAVIGMSATEQISDRAANIDRYQGVADTVVDLYGSVRNAYFQRRAADLKK